ncbi:MAG: IclR family transcriptional regulator [Firmicutes bacterium]|nr:IclR family transcriptional regulator [Bacillota bacterium]
MAQPREPKGEKQILGSLYRAMEVLECFATANTPTLKDIVAQTKMPRTTVFRALKTFVALEYLEYDGETGRYALSPKLFRLGSMAINSSSLARFARPVMEAIWARFGETVYLNIRSGDERLCIASLPCTQPLQVNMPVGHRSPLYAGATAKVLLTSLSDSAIEGYLKRTPLVKLTDNTPTNTEKLWQDIRRIRERGYAHTSGERIKGVQAFSVPIYDHTGSVAAALSLLIPSARVEDVDIEAIKDTLLTESARLSQKLGAPGGKPQHRHSWP